MENKDFCVFILTHGRADKVYTYATLQKGGYTGKIYFIIDNEDKQAAKYIENFGAENVLIFDKKAMADTIDECNNFDNRSVIVHARNYCFVAAKELGIKYFLELDDDYTGFTYKWPKTKNQQVKNFDIIFDLVLEYYKTTTALSIAFAQEGDFLGGVDNGTRAYRFSKRKCMNSFFCSTEREFKFIGSLNEDVNIYTGLASRGDLFLTIPVIALCQKATQSQAGGMSDIYKLKGTYIKSFTTVLICPSCVKVSMMNSKNRRLHHAINWTFTAPMILNKKHKK